MKTILISNDDGIDSPGIKALEEALSPLGEIFVVAPDREQSACSHALTLQHPLRAQHLDDHHLAVDGTPSDCVHLALNGLFNGKKFDLIASGINKGGNMGDDISYSGTVSAAMEGTLFGVPSFAISLDAREDFLWEAPGQWAFRIARCLLENGLPPNTLWNVNVPNLALGEILGCKPARQGKRIYGDSVAEKLDPRGRSYFWIGGQELGYEPIEGSDLEVVANRYVAITPVNLDMTDYKQLALMAGMKI